MGEGWKRAVAASKATQRSQFEQGRIAGLKEALEIAQTRVPVPDPPGSNYVTAPITHPLDAGEIAAAISARISHIEGK